jgi:hypothetical protein
MRRVITLILCSFVLLSLYAGPAASDEERGCPPEASGFVLYPINDPDWMIGDPLPAPGEEPIWDITVAGTLEVFPSLEEAAEAFGFASVDELYEFALAGWLSVDTNADSSVCIQDFPVTPGLPPYVFNFVDNHTRVPK